jgi:hypothetical protein
MPQIQICMADMQDARENRINESVFGMLSDGKEFGFSFLDENRKLIVSSAFNMGSDARYGHRKYQHHVHQRHRIITSHNTPEAK